MSILEDIQSAAIDGKSDLATILRKCKLLAARLDSEPLENWVLWESNGYPKGVVLPDYRIWGLELTGNFMGPFNSGLQNVPIPLGCVPEEARTHYQKYECRGSITSIERFVASDETTFRVVTGDLAVILGTDVYEGQNCIQVWATFGSVHLVEVLNAVRNRILDFALAVWKESPTAGELNAPMEKIIEPEHLTQIFHTTVYDGGSAVMVGSASHSPINLQIIRNDFESLKTALKKQGLSPEEIQELHTAIGADAKPTAKDKFGPKVSSWVGRMVMKSAEGTLHVGVKIASDVLSQAIMKFYGFS